MKEILDFKYKEQGSDCFINKKHTHTFHYELLHIHSGSGVIMVGERLFPIEKDTLVLINGIDIHCSVPDNPAEYVRSKIVISSEFIQKIAADAKLSDVIQDLFIRSNGLCVKLREDETNFVDLEMKKIEGFLAKKSIYQTASVMLSLFQIILCAHQNLHRDITTLNNKTAEIIAYLNQNLDHKISLDELCHHFHISKYYLCHTFKKTFGMTIYNYIFAQRISIAKRKLIYTNESLTEISLSTGFSSSSYFSKTFKEYEGISPKDFRKKHQSSAIISLFN